VLESFRDVWAWDSTCIGLRRQLAESFAVGAQSERAGAKLHGAISLRSQAIVRPRITAQKVHDARGIDLGNKLEDVLVLLDRGYSGHRLFADIVEGGGAFLTRLKTSTNPRILMAHSPAEEVAGKTLDEALEAEELDLDEPIDLDVELTVERIGSLDARVIGIPVENEEGTELWWYLTSLDREEFPPATIELLYRLRWQVELLWKQLKSRFRLHEVSAITDHNVRLIMETAVLAHVLSLGVMDAVTTRTERKKLTVGRMALAFPYALPNLLSILFDDEEEEEKEEKARKFRRAVLSSASDTNPKRTRQSALRRAKRARKSRSARAKS
jgi:putative transposase